jgi:hypothetical protein
VAAFGGVEKIQNGGRCHGNQGAKNVSLQGFIKFDQGISEKSSGQKSNVWKNNSNNRITIHHPTAVGVM